MENLYNAKVSFKGDGSFNFVLPGYGELVIYAGRDIYFKGLTVQAVELLRQLRPLMLEHQLNAKPDGCFRVIDLTSLKPVNNKVKFERAYKEPAPQSVADLKASLIKTTGPIIDEEPKIEEPKIEEPKIEEKGDKEDGNKEETIDKSNVGKSNTAIKNTSNKGKTSAGIKTGLKNGLKNGTKLKTKSKRK